MVRRRVPSRVPASVSLIGLAEDPDFPSIRVGASSVWGESSVNQNAAEPSVSGVSISPMKPSQRGARRVGGRGSGSITGTSSSIVHVWLCIRSPVAAGSAAPRCPPSAPACVARPCSIRQLLRVRATSVAAEPTRASVICSLRGPSLRAMATSFSASVTPCGSHLYLAIAILEVRDRANVGGSP